MRCWSRRIRIRRRSIAKTGNETQLVVLGADVVTGHDLKTGEEVWRMTGFNPTNDRNFRTIASAVYQDGIVYAPTRERPLQAFRIGGRGDITKIEPAVAIQQRSRRADAAGGWQILLFD